MTRKQKPQWIINYGFLIGVLASLIMFTAAVVTYTWLFPDGKQQREQSIVQVDTKSGNAPRERLVTFKDDRTVLCVDWAGALSCDWENAK